MLMLHNFFKIVPRGFLLFLSEREKQILVWCVLSLSTRILFTRMVLFTYLTSENFVITATDTDVLALMIHAYSHS